MKLNPLLILTFVSLSSFSCKGKCKNNSQGQNTSLEKKSLKSPEPEKIEVPTSDKTSESVQLPETESAPIVKTGSKVIFRVEDFCKVINTGEYVNCRNVLEEVPLSALSNLVGFSDGLVKGLNTSVFVYQCESMPLPPVILKVAGKTSQFLPSSAATPFTLESWVEPRGSLLSIEISIPKNARILPGCSLQLESNVTLPDLSTLESVVEAHFASLKDLSTLYKLMPTSTAGIEKGDCSDLSVSNGGICKDKNVELKNELSRAVKDHLKQLNHVVDFLKSEETRLLAIALEPQEPTKVALEKIKKLDGDVRTTIEKHQKEMKNILD